MDTAATSHSNKSVSVVATQMVKEYQYSKNDKRLKWEPLFIVLVILGVIGLSIGSVGFAKLGKDLGWWKAGSISSLGQIHSLVLMGVGFGLGILCLTVGIIGLVKLHCKKEVAALEMKKEPNEENRN